jgi:hypothetical protein
MDAACQAASQRGDQSSTTANKHTDAQAFRTLLAGNEKADCILPQLSEPQPEASGKTIVKNANLAFSVNR